MNQLSVVSCQLSVVSCRLSAVSCQLSVWLLECGRAVAWLGRSLVAAFGHRSFWGADCVWCVIMSSWPEASGAVWLRPPSFVAQWLRVRPANGRPGQRGGRQPVAKQANLATPRLPVASRSFHRSFAGSAGSAGAAPRPGGGNGGRSGRAASGGGAGVGRSTELPRSTSSFRGWSRRARRGAITAS